MKIQRQHLSKIIKEETHKYLKEIDESAAIELEFYINNTGELHKQMQSIRKNLVNKKAKGVYDSMLAVKLMMYLVQTGAKMYTKEFGAAGEDYKNVFDKATRMEVAKSLVKDFEEESGLSNYDDLLHKKYQVKEGGQNPLSELVYIVKDMLEKKYGGDIDKNELSILVANEIDKLMQDTAENSYSVEESSRPSRPTYAGNSVRKSKPTYAGKPVKRAKDWEKEEDPMSKAFNNKFNEGASNEVYELYETLLEALGPEMLLQELMRAMSSQEAQENLEHIAQMHDIAIGVGEYLQENLKKSKKKKPSPYAVAWASYKKSKK